MDYQWFPGHMTKAMRQMKEDIKLIDLIIELLDARIPLSSRNPEIDNLGQNKARLVLLNKADLADEKQNNKWIEYFKKKGIAVGMTTVYRQLDKMVSEGLVAKYVIDGISRALRKLIMLLILPVKKK